MLIPVLYGSICCTYHQLKYSSLNRSKGEQTTHWTLPYYEIIFTVHKYIHPSVNKVPAGTVRVSAIHRTLTWTTGSLTCCHPHSCDCVYSRGLGRPTASQHYSFDSGEKMLKNSCVSDGVRTLVTDVI